MGASPSARPTRRGRQGVDQRPVQRVAAQLHGRGSELRQHRVGKVLGNFRNPRYVSEAKPTDAPKVVAAMSLVESIERAGERLKARAHLRTRLVMDARPFSKRTDSETVFFEVAGRNAKLLLPVEFRILPKGLRPLTALKRPHARSRPR